MFGGPWHSLRQSMQRPRRTGPVYPAGSPARSRRNPFGCIDTQIVELSRKAGDLRHIGDMPPGLGATAARSDSPGSMASARSKHSSASSNLPRARSAQPRLFHPAVDWGASSTDLRRTFRAAAVSPVQEQDIPRSRCACASLGRSATTCSSHNRAQIEARLSA